MVQAKSEAFFMSYAWQILVLSWAHFDLLSITKCVIKGGKSSDPFGWSIIPWPKGHSLVPRQGKCLGLQVQTLLRAWVGGNQSIFLSHINIFFFLPLLVVSSHKKGKKICFILLTVKKKKVEQSYCMNRKPRKQWSRKIAANLHHILIYKVFLILVY